MYTCEHASQSSSALWWQAECRSAVDKARIMSELEQNAGFVECNKLVVGLLREALVAQAWEVLERLPAAKRGTSVLINDLSRLLQDMGQLEEARPLLMSFHGP